MLTAPTSSLALFGLPGNSEIIILVVLGLLIFGRRLPDVGRSLGRSIVEFKKGVKGIEDEVNEAADKKPERLEDKSQQTKPAPIDQAQAAEPSPYATADKPQTQE